MPALKKGLKTLLHKWFDIRDGEFRTAIMMQLNIFLLISTLLIVKPNVTALFLSRFGAERLPEAFVFVALTALLFSRLYIGLLNTKTFNLIIERTLMFSFLILVVFLVLLKAAVFEGVVLYSFYIWIAVFALLATSQFWVLANLVYNIREAKRLFSFIGAGAISGGIFGGYLTTILAPVIGSENVLLIAALFLLVCIPVTRTIWRENVSTLSVFRRKKRNPALAENPVNLILRSRHLLYLAGIIGISVIVAKFVDYQFSDIAHRSISDPDELAAFFGFWFSTLNLLSLFIQLFFTPLVVGVLGVGVSLLFLPIGILVGATVLFLFPGLASAVLVKTADGSFKQSINKAAIELLGLPIQMEIKNRTKTFIDVVVDSIATGIAGFILIFIVNGLELSARFVSIGIILLIGFWIYLVSRVRKEYIKSFRTELKKTVTDSGPTPLPPTESIVQGIESVLESGTEKQIIFILKKIREIENDHLFNPVQKLLGHSSEKVRAEAIRTLYQFQNRSLVDDIKPFINDPDKQVKLATFEYLFEHAEEETMELFNQYLYHENTDIANAALLSLAIETRNNETLKKFYQLEKIIGKKRETIEKETNQQIVTEQTCLVLEAIGHAHIDNCFPYLERMLKDNRPEVVRSAIKSSGLTLNPVFIHNLVEFLKADDFREDAKNALSVYGPPVINHLLDMVERRQVPDEVLPNIPSIIDQFDSQKAVNALLKLLYNPNLDLRFEAIRSLRNLKVNESDLNFHKQKIAKIILEEGQLYLDTLSAMYAEIIVNFKKENSSQEKQKEDKTRRHLIEILEQRLDSDLELIFRLLDLKYPSDDIDIAYNGIRSDNPEQRTNAIEFLDNLLEPDLKRILIPIVETIVLDSISETSLRSLSFKIPSEKECFEILLSRNDRRIKLAVLKLIGLMGEETYLPMIYRYSNSEDPIIQRFANEALARLSNP